MNVELVAEIVKAVVDDYLTPEKCSKEEALAVYQELEYHCDAASNALLEEMDWMDKG